MIYDDNFDSTALESFWNVGTDSTNITFTYSTNAQTTYLGGDTTSEDSTAIIVLNPGTINEYNTLSIYSGLGKASTSPNGIYQDTTGDFDVEVCIHPHSKYKDAYDSNGYGGGIMVRISDDNYMFILVTKNALYFEYKYSYSDGGFGYSGQNSRLTSFHIRPPFNFRIKRTGTTFQPYIKMLALDYVGGMESKQIGEIGDNVEIWLISNHYSENYSLKMDFDYFRNYSS